MGIFYCSYHLIYHSVYYLVPPKWIQEPRDVQAIVGQDITLPCSVDGFPKPSTVWTRTNGKKFITH
jgi:hypothetical protein